MPLILFRIEKKLKSKNTKQFCIWPQVSILNHFVEKFVYRNVIKGVE